MKTESELRRDEYIRATYNAYFQTNKNHEDIQAILEDGNMREKMFIHALSDIYLNVSTVFFNDIFTACTSSDLFYLANEKKELENGLVSSKEIS